MGFRRFGDKGGVERTSAPHKRKPQVGWKMFASAIKRIRLNEGTDSRGVSKAVAAGTADLQVAE